LVDIRSKKKNSSDNSIKLRAYK